MPWYPCFETTPIRRWQKENRVDRNITMLSFTKLVVEDTPRAFQYKSLVERHACIKIRVDKEFMWRLMQRWSLSSTLVILLENNSSPRFSCPKLTHGDHEYNQHEHGIPSYEWCSGTVQGAGIFDTTTCALCEASCNCRNRIILYSILQRIAWDDLFCSHLAMKMD